MQENGMGETTPPTGPGDLFRGFLGVGMLGFGGVLALARRMMVEERRWVSAGEFTELLSLCQFLPGPNVCNLSIAVGRRFHGLAGACAAIAGLMGAPVVIAIGLGMAYGRFGDVPMVAHVLAGLAAGAAGLVLATAVKVGLPLWRRDGAAARRRWLGLGVAGVAFVLVALVRAPLLPTMLALAPVSVWLHGRRPS